MTTALIGSTGFVGGNLRRQTHFDDFFHSTDIDQIRGRRYHLLVCAGAPAEKWRANKEPDRDRETLARLTEALAEVEAQRVVLVSTIDVYPDPRGVDESTPLAAEAGQPYGRHRLALERFVAGRFETTVVRLPALFGPGLKKNVVFDILNGKPTDGVAGESVFQYYDLERIWADVETALRHRLPVVNLSTEGVSVAEMARAAFGIEYRTKPEAKPINYDMRTRHAALFGGAGDYIESRVTVLERLRRFVEASGWRRP
jgi:nucleoside-diphosphate-sugar epimerase